MYSQKTTNLIMHINALSHSGRKCVVIKYDADARYSDETLSSHDKLSYKAVKCSKNGLLFLLDLINDYDVIGIDEGQFYDDLVDFCIQVQNNDKICIVAGLDGDYQRNPFESISNLIPHCTYVEKVRAYCKCGKEAPYTFRTTNSVEREVIGGTEMYEAVCVSHPYCR